MKPFVLFLALLIAVPTALAASIDTTKLDQLFAALEQRNEAMGSIVVSQNGRVVYSRAIGFRLINDETSIPADVATNYRIWSITKMYTAVMIMQLVEEGRLSLQTTLDQFYPTIPNAEIISIQQMLEHSSGIHDFTQNVSSEDWDAEINEPMTSAFMLDHIAEHPSDFLPGTSFNYSNSNYLLLGYIIEQLDGNNYGLSLSNRIATKLGLTSTYFGVGALDSVANKAYSYRYDKQWQLVDEGEFSGLIPAGAGGIVGTVQDMVRFIEALFGGQLISENSLQQMLPTGDAFYGLGIMQFSSQEGVGYGHTGGYKASESSLVYYPADSLTIAYATNGIVLRKEDILRHVHDICKGKPFAVSMNRCWQAALVFGFGLVVLLLGRRSFMQYASAYLRFAGLAITVVFWLGQFLAGRMHAKYDPIRDALTTLDSFYSASGTFMAGIQFSIALLMLPFAWQLYRYCRGVQVSVVPVLSIFFII
ncbi:MAG: serine hydrolase domain-containing protein, partial [Bacteroidota bacterium]